VPFGHVGPTGAQDLDDLGDLAGAVSRGLHPDRPPVPSRLSPRSYQGHDPSPLAMKFGTAMRDSSMMVLP
jgi:hypothetical protein